jgi:acetyltransferase-like isoleucine patch superfamily enzyme
MERGQTGQNVALAADTVLGAGVTMGNNVTFYPGVTVGDGCTIFDGAVIGRPPMRTGITTREVADTAPKLSIGAGSIIGANAVLYTGIEIGEEVLIGDLASIREGCVIKRQAVVGRSVLVMYETVIGERTRIIDGAIITGNMLIEEDVFIGPGVHTINDDDVYLKRFGLLPFSVQGPTIRRWALVGTGATLSAGIEIGEGAIVAPHAMVTTDVAAWAVVAGVPAKVVRQVDDATREQVRRTREGQ